MKIRSEICAGFLLALTLTLGPAATGQAADKKPMTPEQQAMMAQMQKYGTPGPNHMTLQKAVGRWTHTVRSWMKPGDTAQVSQGMSENSMVLGGRFLKQEAKGDMNGQMFEGLGYTGFDILRGEYQSIWMDNMGTGMMIGSGTSDPATQKIRQTGTFSCPMTGDKATWYRSEWNFVDNDNQVYTMYFKGPDGKEFKSLEIVYKRMK